MRSEPTGKQQANGRRQITCEPLRTSRLVNPNQPEVTMIEQLIEASIRNRFLVLIAAAMLTLAGVHAMYQTPVDAIPDLSENQVIVFTDWMGRSPREVEDQVTYPLARKLQ